MCLIATQFYSSCGHNSRSNPDCCINLVDNYCPTCLGLDCPYRNEIEEHQAGKCQKCLGIYIVPLDHWKLGQYYKYCEQSTICKHEYNHIITDLERLDHEADRVLVTLTKSLCPECKGLGIDYHPSKRPAVSITPTASLPTRSRMPLDFINLPRISMSDFSSSRASDGGISTISIVPNGSFRPSIRSAIGGSSCTPGASRVLTSTRAETPRFLSNNPYSSISKQDNAVPAIPRSSMGPSSYPSASSVQQEDDELTLRAAGFASNNPYSLIAGQRGSVLGSLGSSSPPLRSHEPFTYYSAPNTLLNLPTSPYFHITPTYESFLPSASAKSPDPSSKIANISVPVASSTKPQPSIPISNIRSPSTSNSRQVPVPSDSTHQSRHVSFAPAPLGMKNKANPRDIMSTVHK